MRGFVLGAGMLIGCAAALGQADLAFDVASVKPTVTEPGGPIYIGPPRGGPGTPDPGQITWSGATLLNVLRTAYDVKNYQVTGPDWLKSERYEIVVKVPAGATKEQVNVMWQNLLKERLGLAMHHASKDFPADELTVPKGGPKLKPTDLDPNAPEFKPEIPAPGARPEPIKNGPDGFPQLPGPGLFIMIQNNAGGLTFRAVAKAQTAAQMAEFLANQVGHPVVDKTGLTGKYDFNLEFKPDANTLPAFLPPPAAPPGGGPGDNASEPGSNLEAALLQQLGLRLVKGKAPLDMIVVDHVEKTPTEN